jgi:hypothetical protein
MDSVLFASKMTKKNPGHRAGNDNVKMMARKGDPGINPG